MNPPKYACPQCGELHDLANLEPSFRRPDAFVAIPEDLRAPQARDTDEGCLISSDNGQHLRAFLRAILRIEILGDRKSIGWGVWVELPAPEYFRLIHLTDDPLQTQAPASKCTLANELPTLAGTLGLPGHVSLTGRATRPAFAFDATVRHPFALEARAGVRPERAMEWRFLSVHPPTARG